MNKSNLAKETKANAASVQNVLYVIYCSIVNKNVFAVNGAVEPVFQNPQLN